MNKGNDYQLKKLLIVNQILPVSILGNVWRTVWRICILMIGCKRVNPAHDKPYIYLRLFDENSQSIN